MEKFRFYAKDKNGEIGIEIVHSGCAKKFLVHYPEYEGAETVFRTRSCFAEMNDYQVAMLLFAYNPEEMKRFEEELRKFIRENCDHHTTEYLLYEYGLDAFKHMEEEDERKRPKTECD